MTALPDPADLAPSRDPADYGRRRLFTPWFWAMIALCLVSVALGAAVVKFAPMFQPKTAPAVKPASAPATPLTLSAPAPAAAPSPQATPEADAVGARLERLEGGQTRALDAAASALAAAALSAAAAGPRPFGDTLAAVQRVLPPTPDALALRPLAERGAPTRAALADELADASASAAVAARQPARDAGFMAQLGYLVSRVISVRRVDGEGAGPDAAIARAARRASDGDLEGAIGIVDTLPAAARDRLADWRSRAERRLEIDRHVAGLRNQALAELAALRSAGR